MATRKKASAAASAGSSATTLDGLLDGILTEMKIEESKTFKPVATGIDVLDFYNARYFQNHETKDHVLFTGMPMGKLILKIGYTGTGKSLPNTFPIATTEGMKTMGDLKVGDMVFGSDGQPTEVVGVFPQGKLETIEVSFEDGSIIDVNKEHLWSVREAGSYADVVKTTADLIAAGFQNEDLSYKWSVPLVGMIDFQHKMDEVLPITPYEYGVGLALNNLHENEAYGDSEESEDPEANRNYIEGSIGTRMAFIQGVMDTVGSFRDGLATLTSSRENLLEAMTFAARSLGGLVSIEYDEVSEQYVLFMKMNSCPFEQDENLVNQWMANLSCVNRKKIIGVNTGETVEHVCIKVAAADELFAAGDSFTVTHNTTLSVQEALQLVAPFEAGRVFHFDLENAWSVDRTIDISGGMDPERVRKIYRRLDPQPLEVIYEFIKKMIRQKQEAIDKGMPGIMVVDPRTGEEVPVPTVVIVDTVAALQSDKVMNENDAIGSLMYEKGAQAGANNAFAQRLAGMIGKVNITLYAVNHIREAVSDGPTRKAKRVQYLGADETVPGGTGFPQYSDYYLKMVPCESLTLTIDEGFAIPGKIVRCTILKSRLSYDGRQFELVLTDEGFSNVWSNLHFLRKEKLLKGAGAHLFIEYPETGEVTQKFAMRNFYELYMTQPDFKRVVDATVLYYLQEVVPLPGSAAESSIMDAAAATLAAESADEVEEDATA